MMARHYWSLGEAVAGGLFLFSGAIFPLDVLPRILRPLGYLFPVTYWLEAACRALLAILAGFSLALFLVSPVFYRWALHQAKEKGLIDMETSY
jgi:ABC-2 type transport system permease protein